MIEDVKKGGARILFYNGINWSPIKIDPLNTSANEFGTTVALSASGDILAIGEPKYMANGFFTGQISIWRLQGENVTYPTDTDFIRDRVLFSADLRKVLTNEEEKLQGRVAISLYGEKADSTKVTLDLKMFDSVYILQSFEKNQVIMGTTLIHSAIHYSGVEGRLDEDSSESVIPVPFFYTSLRPWGDKFALGVGSNAPFGLVTKYSSVGNFRHIAYYNDLKAAGYHVSAAYEASPSLSFGVGWSYLDVDLKQVGKFNSSILTGDPQDAVFEYEAGGHGQGWNVGMLWTPTSVDTYGVSFRSEVRSHLKGTMSTHDLTGGMAFVFGGPSTVTSVDTDITFPANLTIGYKRQFNDKFDWEIDLSWTGWSSYDTLDTVFGTSNAILAGFEHIGKDYLDTFSLNTGGTYVLSDTWKVNAGYFFYTQASNKNNYTNESPDGKQHGVSIGLEYSQNNWALDIMYIAIFQPGVRIENVSGLANGADIDGEYSNLTQLISTGITYNF